MAFFYALFSRSVNRTYAYIAIDPLTLAKGSSQGIPVEGVRALRVGVIRSGRTG